MNRPERMQRIQELFHAALERPREQHESFLSAACAEDAALRQEVAALLAAHEEEDGFLDAAAREEATAILPAPPAATLTSGQSISHYRLLSLLGKGGMGEVYLAQDVQLGRKAALKILPVRFTVEPELVQRFEREAKAASALNHPNILTVYEIGKTDDSHFIATELIEGETLRQRLVRAPLPLVEALDIAVQIAAALTAAHEAGIIHRDIKPENIMLRPDGYVKVLDFGLAKLTEAEPNPEDVATQTGMIMGTPSYMSPEQARGQKVDFRTDLWSLGVVLYEMVAHARPFSGASQADLLVSILERPPQPLPVALPGALVSILDQLLAKDPAQRYAAARVCGQDLKALQHKLTFAEEMQNATPPADTEQATLQQIIEAPTLQLPPTAVTERSADPIVAAPAVSVPAPRRVTAAPVLVGLVLLAGLGTGLWYWLRPVSAPPVVPPAAPAATTPKRTLTWWLTVQRMLGGKLEDKAFQSAGRDWFPSKSKFKFNFISPQAGYLYLLNEGLTDGGETSLNLLYPTPANKNGNAAAPANQTTQTGNNQFDVHEGEEKFWIVWAAQPVAEIETVKAAAAAALSEIKDPTQRSAILSLLKQHLPQAEAKSDEEKEQTFVTSSSDLLVSLVKLKHR